MHRRLEQQITVDSWRQPEQKPIMRVERFVTQIKARKRQTNTIESLIYQEWVVPRLNRDRSEDIIQPIQCRASILKSCDHPGIICFKSLFNSMNRNNNNNNTPE